MGEAELQEVGEEGSEVVDGSLARYYVGEVQLLGDSQVVEARQLLENLDGEGG